MPDVWFLQHGTGHGFGAFLTVHEGDHGFNSNVPLMPGHVITNEPGFCTALVLFDCILDRLTSFFFIRPERQMGRPN